MRADRLFLSALACLVRLESRVARPWKRNSDSLPTKFWQWHKNSDNFLFLAKNTPERSYWGIVSHLCHLWCKLASKRVKLCFVIWEHDFENFDFFQKFSILYIKSCQNSLEKNLTILIVRIVLPKFWQTKINSDSFSIIVRNSDSMATLNSLARWIPCWIIY